MKLTDKFSGVKVFDIINRYNIETVEQAQLLTDEQLLKCRHVGPLFIKKLRSIATEQPEAQKVDDVQWQDIMTTAAGIEPEKAQSELSFDAYCKLIGSGPFNEPAHTIYKTLMLHGYIITRKHHD